MFFIVPLCHAASGLQDHVAMLSPLLEKDVVGELGSVVDGDGLALLPREVAENVHDDSGGLGDILAGEARSQGEAAFVPNEYRTGLLRRQNIRSSL